MQPVPTDLILHALAENLIGMEGDKASFCTLGHAILNSCVDPRALPAQWCNGAGVGQQMSWLTRRIVDGDTHPHVAAETRAMEVAISRRLADTAFSLLVTQDDGDKTAALTLLEAAHRVVGLPSWPSNAKMRDCHDAVSSAWASALCNKYRTLYEEWRAWASEVANTPGGTDPGLQALIKHTHTKASTLVAQHEEMYAALCREVNAARTEAAAHLKDVKTARDEADALRQKVATLERDHAVLGEVEATASHLAAALARDNNSLRANLTARNTIIKNFTDQWETWARNLLGVDDGTAQELQGLIGKKLSQHELRASLNIGLHKETEAWSAWAERTSGRHNPTAPHARQAIERRIGDMAAVRDALKLGREASHEDIIETIKSLQADRAKLCALVCGDNDKTVDAPVDAPRFKIDDCVLAYAKIINEHRGLFLVDIDGSAVWLHPDNMRHVQKVES